MKKCWLINLPSVDYWDNSGSILGNVLEDRLREIKMMVGRITPAAGRAEVSSGDHNYARQAPLWIIYTSDLKASPTAQTIVEQCSAQCCGVSSITLAVQISIATSPTLKHNQAMVSQDNIVRRLYIIELACTWFSYQKEKKKEYMSHIPIVPEASPPP